MSVKTYKNFLDYWDSRFDENEKFLNNYPQLANFTFRECYKLWDDLHSDYAALRARVARLEEAVKELHKISHAALCTRSWMDVRCITSRALEEK